MVNCKIAPCEYSLTVHQEASYLQLIDGYPQYVEFNGNTDTSRLFKFDLPPGQREVFFTINPNNDNFFPYLWVRQFNKTERYSSAELTQDFEAFADKGENHRHAKDIKLNDWRNKKIFPIMRQSHVFNSDP